MTATAGHAWADSWLAAEHRRELRVVEREVLPPLHELEAERRRATPRKKQEPAERTLDGALLDGLPTKGL